LTVGYLLSVFIVSYFVVYQCTIAVWQSFR